MFNNKKENKKEEVLYLLPVDVNDVNADILEYTSMLEKLSEDRKKELMRVFQKPEFFLQRKRKDGYYSILDMATIRGHNKEVEEPVYISIPGDPDLLEIFANDVVKFENMTIAMKNILYLLPIKSLEDEVKYRNLIKNSSLISEEEKEELDSLINKGKVWLQTKLSEDKYDITPILNAPKNLNELISKGGYFIGFSGDENLHNLLAKISIEYEENLLPDKNVNCFVKISEEKPENNGPRL